MPPFRSTAITQSHGVDAARVKYAARLEVAKPVKVGIASRGIPDTLVSERLDPKQRYAGATNSHDTTAANHLLSFAPDKFQLVESIISSATNNPSHYGMLDGIVAAINGGCVSVCAPFHSNSGMGWNYIQTALDESGCGFGVVYHTESSQPAYQSTLEPRAWPTVLIGFEESGGPYNADLQGVVVKTGAASWAGPLAASAIAFLKMLAPESSTADIVQAIIKTAPIVNGKRFLRVDLAADVLIGEVAQPKPEPTYPRTLADGERVKFDKPATVTLSNVGEIVGDGATVLEGVQ